MIDEHARETWVKTCGMTRRSDIEHAVEAGADAVGVVTFSGSPRFVSPQVIPRLFAGIPILRYVLTVDVDPHAALELVRLSGADGIQPYGSHAATTSRVVADAGFRVLRPYRAAPDLVIDEPHELDGDVVPLIDTPHDSLHGGSGEVFDWTMVSSIETRYVLAGGLGPDNVRQAIAAVRPWGVDAASGLEAAPGVKDPGKVTAFVAAAKSREASPL